MLADVLTALKGFAMGAANVIPGVSGGTIAFITGIYERLIEALKRFDAITLKMVLQFQLAQASRRVDLRFLVALGVGIVVSFATLARVLKWGFEKNETAVWAFFFGLIAASLPVVGRMVRHWTAGALAALAIGLALSLSMAFLSPASENTNPVYLVLCGVVAAASMIIPGLSGSFVLLLMGNYKLIMIESLTKLFDMQFAEALRVLIPVGIGAVLGIAALARFLSWLFRRYHDVAVALITGFIGGSLAIIWPWKDTLTETFQRGGEIKEKIVGFENWHLPALSESATWLPLGLLVAGAILILALERLAPPRP